MNRPPSLLSHLLLLALLALLGAVSLAWCAAALVLYRLLPPQRGRDLGRAVIAAVYRTFWQLASLAGMLRIDSTALDRLRDERGLIVVANHPSLLDALLLVARLPRSACIMKAELMGNVFLGAGARLARYIRNDSPRTLVRRAVDDLKAGGQLIVFPEGTRTTQPPVNPFRPGVTLIAKRARAPIQTVFIDTDSPYLRKGWPLWRLPPLPIVFSLRLGERFAPRDDSDALLADLARYYAAGVQPRPAALSASSAARPGRTGIWSGER
jgi:1-acyl-sn-glycerol-3-phosphate acyltransferase